MSTIFCQALEGRLQHFLVPILTHIRVQHPSYERPVKTFVRDVALIYVSIMKSAAVVFRTVEKCCTSIRDPLYDKVLIRCFKLSSGEFGYKMRHLHMLAILF